MQRTRRFTIADVMILVSAAAVSSLILRFYMPGFERQLGFVGRFGSDFWNLQLAYAWIQGPGSCVVVPLMASLIAIRLLPPRPRHLRIQPGFVACVAVLVSLVPGILWYATIQYRPGFRRADAFEQTWGCVIFWTSCAVIGAWLALALGRRFRPEPSWVDRTGRVLGAYWVFVVLAGFAIAWVLRLANLFPKAWRS
jgi:hypothetical protein